MKTGAHHSIMMRINLSDTEDQLPHILNIIQELGAEVTSIDAVAAENHMTSPHHIADGCQKDLIIHTSGEEHIALLKEKIEQLPQVFILQIIDRTFLLHQGGKIETHSKIHIVNRDQLSMAYTPGVARVCMDIHHHPEKAFDLTIRKNTVAIVTDGTAVLGLGNIGPLAALPVMEGKAMLFKEFANVDAFPICLDTQDLEEIIRTVKYLAPNFGGINLEDIAAPRCFEIETRLKAELDIPVFHDDQHGTAIVTTAALINALKIVNKKPHDLKVVINGVGAAGTACTQMLLKLGVTRIIGCDRNGILDATRHDLNTSKLAYVKMTNPDQEKGTLYDAIKDADVFIGVSSADILSVSDIKKMNKDPIIFAMANPNPEIKPELALPHVAIMATGRSDYPNQINNLLAFPGIFRGALDCQAYDINSEMQMAAAYAIASIITPAELTPQYIIPSVFNTEVVNNVAMAVIKAAHETHMIRKRSL